MRRLLSRTKTLLYAAALCKFGTQGGTSRIAGESQADIGVLPAQPLVPIGRKDTHRLSNPFASYPV